MQAKALHANQNDTNDSCNFYEISLLASLNDSSSVLQ